MRDFQYGDIFEAELLKTFVLVVRLGSFTAAAESLGISQSAVSYQIKRLESFTHQELLDRQYRGVRLTKAGERLLKYAESILDLHYEALEAVLLSSREKEVRIGCPDVYWSMLSSEVLNHIQRNFPDAQLRVFCDTSTRVYELFDAQKLDIALAIRHEYMPRGEALQKEELVWVANQELDLRSLKEIPLVVFEEDCIYRRNLIDALEKNSWSWRIRLISQNTAAIRSAIRDGLGISILARSTVPSDLQVIESSKLPELESATLELCVLNEKSELIQCVADSIRSFYSESSRDKMS